MPAIPVGTGRITINYAPGAPDHDFHMFVKDPTLSGGNYVIDKRTDIGGTGAWEDAADDLAAAISNIITTAVVVQPALLEIYDGVAWNPVATHAITFPNGPAATVFGATQLTATFYDVAFHHIKPTVFDITFTAPAHFTSPTGGNANCDAYIKEFTENYTLADPPYIYAISVWGEFIRPGGFIAATATLNRVQRKRWGFA